MSQTYLEVTQESGAAFFRRNIQGPVVMLNMLRFREIADYSTHPALDPGEEISGRAAYQKYIEHTLPFLKESGGEVIFLGEGGAYVIGPSEISWDMIMLVRHKSVSAFMDFASNEGYLKGAGHRTAALGDSRLLPIVEQ